MDLVGGDPLQLAGLAAAENHDFLQRLVGRVVREGGHRRHRGEYGKGDRGERQSDGGLDAVRGFHRWSSLSFGP